MLSARTRLVGRGRQRPLRAIRAPVRTAATWPARRWRATGGAVERGAHCYGATLAQPRDIADSVRRLLVTLDFLFMEPIRTDFKGYEGKFVELDSRTGEIVLAAEDLEGLFEQAKGRDHIVLGGRVPFADEPIPVGLG